VVEAEDKKKRKNSSVNKVDMEEDEVHGEEVGREPQMLSASSVADF